jgi:hypothetical protein
MAKTINWLAALSAFVKDHPKTSAAVAFNLGIVAARATRKAQAAMPDLADMRSQVIELVPSMKDIKELSAYVPLLGPPKPAAKPKRAVKRSSKKRKAPARRKAAKKRAA